MTQSVMLALVSDQPMPNIMAILQYLPRPDHVEFIVSADKEHPNEYDPHYNAKYHALCRAIQPLGISCSRLPPVHPYRLQDVEFQCLAALAKHSDAEGRVVNVTGGTKLMAFAAYRAALTTGVPMVYLESRDRRLITVSQGESRTRPFDESLFSTVGVAQYLTAYGRIIDKQTPHSTLSGRDVSMTHRFVQDLGPARVLLGKIASGVRAKGDGTAPRRFELEALPSTQQTLLDQLVAAGYLKPSRQSGQFAVVDETGWHFLNGVWLEVYTFDALFHSGHFDDVRCNVHLKGAPGELDVVLTRNASLAICEAKLGAKLAITMARLRALRETLAGVYGRTFYVTVRTTVTRDMENLAKVFGVTRIILGPDLPDIARLIAEMM